MSEDRRRVYPVDDVWVISDGYWLPGRYATEDAAWAAFDLDDSVLIELRDSLDGAAATTEQVHAARPTLDREET